MVFSKELWLIDANKDLADGILNQAEVDDAIRIWVDPYNGKTKEELEDMNLPDKWFK